jgi:SAM-dependent methyltransferase
MRARAIVHAITLELYGRSLALPDLPARPDLLGLGLSDWEGYARPLAVATGYRNTYFHQEPRVDIVDPDPALFGRFDFLISSEVFEHVPPPVERAFDGARRLLKPGALLVLTVPYGDQHDTVEHFPDLHDYEILDREGRSILRNTTRGGATQEFPDPVFHGGPGSTLEMRLFSEASLRRHLERAGFRGIRVVSEDVLAWGIRWCHSWSLPLTARAG